MTPRFLRMRDAPAYLGMDREVFNAAVRPGLTEIPIGVLLYFSKINHINNLT